ncbi:MAG: TRAM domain-containing protein [Verrucomicrobia bacterium]|nr:TRAM domain-containing protein [Verrucomicrobiota bacterium]
MTEDKKPSFARISPFLVIAIAVLATALVAALILRPRARAPEVIIERVTDSEPGAVDVYKGEIIDATGGGHFEVEEGHRYKVLIEDAATEGTAGIAKIGGLITFVSGAEPGEVVIIEVTRKKKSSAEAAVVEHVSRVDPAEMPKREREGSRPSPVEVGKTYRGRVGDIGKKGDGIVHVGGKVVFVPGVQVGEDVSFRVVEDLPKFARGEVVTFYDQSTESEPFTETPLLEAVPDSSSEVKAGARFDVEITEKDRKKPDTDGVARIDGLVVFVPNSQPGDRCSIVITERRDRFARAERTDL